MRKIALCIHDLRTSNPAQVESIVDFIYKKFNAAKLTIHLIVDEEPAMSNPALVYLNQLITEQKAEVVFHGVDHYCTDQVAKLWAWYHKYEAEFLSNNFNAQKNTDHYTILSRLLKQSLGICPPCWLANKKGWQFIRDLNPLYIEKLFKLEQEEEAFTSPVLSLGSDQKREQKILSILLKASLGLTQLASMDRIRVILHVKDFTSRKSIGHIFDCFNSLINNGYNNVLQKDLLLT